MDLLAIRLWSDLAAHARLGFRVLERFNAADFDSCFTPAAGCDGRRGENDVFTFDATEEGLPLVGRKHPNQMAIRPRHPSRPSPFRPPPARGRAGCARWPARAGDATSKKSEAESARSARGHRRA